MRTIVRQYQEYARSRRLSVPAVSITDHQIHSLAMDPQARRTFIWRIQEAWQREQNGGGSDDDGGDSE